MKKELTTVLIIDDSAFMRKALEIMLNSDPDIEVVGMARDGNEGIEKVKDLCPDVVTLDIEMPGLNGLETLDIIMKEVPTPVLVVSSISTEGAEITLDALDRGAVDFIPKTQSFVAIDITKIKDDLLKKIKTIAKKRSYKSSLQQKAALKKRQARLQPTAPKEKETILSLNKGIKCITIGVSTGGPPVVQSILSALPKDFPVPIMIAQHMPEAFTGPFAKRLDSLSNLSVVEAKNGDRIEKGYAFIGKGGKHLIAERQGVNVYTKLTAIPSDLLYFPSVDILVSSAANVWGSQTLGVQLTGMGKDGLLGMKELYAKGGTIIAQNEASCVVYGMPKVVVDAGIAAAALSVDGISNTINTIG